MTQITLSMGQYRVSAYGHTPLQAAIKAVWNLHVFALGRKFGFNYVAWWWR